MGPNLHVDPILNSTLFAHLICDAKYIYKAGSHIHAGNFTLLLEAFVHTFSMLSLPVHHSLLPTSLGLNIASSGGLSAETK